MIDRSSAIPELQVTMSYDRERLKSLIANSVLIDEGHPQWPRLQELDPHMPWLFDFKRLLGNTDFLTEVAEAFWQTCADWYPFQLAGLETAAFPMMTAIQLIGKQQGRDVSAILVRKSRKKYGLFQDYDGSVSDLPILMVDDLINKGKTLFMCKSKLAGHGDKVRFGFSLLEMEDPATRAALEKNGIEWRSLYGLSEFGKKSSWRRNSAKKTVDRLRPRLAWKWSEKGPIYQFPYPKSAVVLNGDRAYAGTNAGSLHAWDAGSGKKVWSLQTYNSTRKGSASTPLIVGDRLVWAAYDGNVYCVDHKSGSVIWTNHMADFIGSSPVWDSANLQVIIATEFSLPGQKGGVLALDIDTGEGCWQHSFAKYAHSTPVVAAELGLLFAGDNSGELACLDLIGGELRWRGHFEGEIKSPLSYHTETGSLLVPCFDGHVHRVSAQNGETIMRYPSHGPVFTQALVHDDLLIFGSTDKFLYIYDFGTGVLKARIKTWGRVFSSPRLWRNAVIFGSNDGMIRLIDLKSLTQDYAFRIRERVLSPVTMGEDKMYINTGNEVFAIRYD